MASVNRSQMDFQTRPRCQKRGMAGARFTHARLDKAPRVPGMVPDSWLLARIKYLDDRRGEDAPSVTCKKQHIQESSDKEESP